MNNVWTQGLLLFFLSLAPSSDRLREDHHDLDWFFWYVGADRGKMWTSPCYYSDQTKSTMPPFIQELH